MSERITNRLKTVGRGEIDINEALTRGVDRVLPDAESLAERIKDNQISLYLGIDPTSPNLHIGHTVPLRKLEHFRELGHRVTLLFGTFTGMIGDPTDKTASRIRLTPEQISNNIQTYEEQAGRILNLSQDTANPVQIAHNHEWLGPLNFEQIIDLAAQFSVQDLLSRSMYQDRMRDNKRIGLHEFLYPLMQGYDSVALEIDMEVGGRDQIPNMLAGRQLVREFLRKEKWVLATKLIEDPSGKKMGKTEGNIVNLNDLPEVKYEAIMTWPDTAIPMGLELITSVPMQMVREVDEGLKSGDLNPLHVKEALAYRVVAETDGTTEADYAQEEFTRVKRQGQIPRRMAEFSAQPGLGIADLLLATGLATTREDAEFKTSKSAIFVNGVQVKGDFVWGGDEAIVQIGQKTIKNVRKIVADSK